MTDLATLSQALLAAVPVDGSTQLRDTLLPRLISGQLRLPEVKGQATEVLS